MTRWTRQSLILYLWWMMLLAAAIGLKGVYRMGEWIPRQIPLVVALPATSSSADVQTLESALVSQQIRFVLEFIPKEQGLEELRTRLLGEGLAVDTGVLDEVPGNPVPDVCVIRAEDAGVYDRIVNTVKAVLPAAQIQYDAASQRRLQPLLKSSRAAGTGLFILLCVLSCLSISDRFGSDRAGSGSSGVGSGWGAAASDGIRAAVFSSLISIVMLGGVLTAIGFASDHRPSWGFRPYTDLALRCVREIGLDGMFAAEYLAGWFILVFLSSCLSAARRRRS